MIEGEKDLAEIGPDLPEVLSSESMKHLYGLAEPAILLGRPLTAAKILQRVLDDWPRDIEVPFTVNLLAGRAAAATGAGSGKERVDDQDAVAWRERGRTWLTAALDAFEALGEGDPERKASAEDIEALLAEPALAALRDPDRVKALPEGEARAWNALWERARRLVLPPIPR